MDRLKKVLTQLQIGTDASTKLLRLYNSSFTEKQDDDKIYRDTCVIVSGLGTAISGVYNMNYTSNSPHFSPIFTYYRINTYIHFGEKILKGYAINNKEYQQIRNYIEKWREIKQNPDNYNLSEVCYEYYNSKFEYKALSWALTLVKNLLKDTSIDVYIDDALKTVEFYSDNLLNMRSLKYYHKMLQYKNFSTDKQTEKTPIFNQHIHFFKDILDTIIKKINNGLEGRTVNKNIVQLKIFYDFQTRDLNGRADFLSRLASMVGIYVLSKYIYKNISVIEKMLQSRKVREEDIDEIMNVFYCCEQATESVFENPRWYNVYKKNYYAYCRITSVIQTFLQSNQKMINKMVFNAIRQVLKNRKKLDNLLNILDYSVDLSLLDSLFNNFYTEPKIKKQNGLRFIQELIL